MVHVVLSLVTLFLASLLQSLSSPSLLSLLIVSIQDWIFLPLEFHCLPVYTCTFSCYALIVSVPEIHSLLFQLCQVELLLFHIFLVSPSLWFLFLLSLMSVHQSDQQQLIDDMCMTKIALTSFRSDVFISLKDFISTSFDSTSSKSFSIISLFFSTVFSDT